MNNIKLTILSLFALIAMTACAGNIEKIKWEKVDSMTYHYEGIHIQPERQRNFTITLTPQKVVSAVDCYNSIVLQEEYDYTIENFKKAVNTLKSKGLKAKKLKDPIAFPDENTHKITLFSEGKVVFMGLCFDNLATYDYKEEPIKATEVFLSAMPEKIETLLTKSLQPKAKPRTKCDINWNEVDYAEYKHSTGSIAPEFYRSYLITVEPDSMVLTVTNYEKELLRRVHPNTPAAFKAFLEKCKAQGFYFTNERDLRTGGSSEKIGFFNGNKVLFKASTDNGLDLEKGALGQEFHAIFPENVNEIVNSTITHR